MNNPHSGLQPLVARPLLSGRDIILSGVWFGLASGLLVAAIHAFRRLVLGQLIWHSHAEVWMAPLAQTIILGSVAVLGAAITSFDRRGMARIVAVAALGFLGAFSVLLIFGAMARWAAALLALGVAVQGTRLFAAAPERWRRRLIRSGATMAVLSSTLGVGSWGAGAATRARIRASLPAAPAGAPNVLLVILDTVRRDHLSLYGFARPTSPALERWAASASVFEAAVATAPWTLPSHGSLFTGKMGSTLGGEWEKPLQGLPVTVGEVLRNHGYATAGFAGNLLYVTRETGLTRGLTDFEDYPLTAQQVMLHSPIVQTALVRDLLDARSLATLKRSVRRFNLSLERPPSSEYRPAPAITDGFLEWQSKQGLRPFFGVLNYFDAHAPYQAPQEILGQFGPSEVRLNRYHAAIAYLDREVDRLLLELGRRGVLDQTVVVVAADHGELFGEQRLTGHANALYLPLLRVPLLIRFPRRVAAARIPEVVSLRDVPATILELAGIAAPNEFGGGSLMSLLGGDSTKPRSAAISELSQGIRVNKNFRNATTWLQSATDQEHHFIRNGQGEEELYRWAVDSLELTNLAGLPASAAVIDRMRARLDSLVGRPR